MENFLLESFSAASIVLGLTQVTKMVGVPSRFAPVASLVLGIGVSYLYGWETWQSGILMGIYYGLSASGLYSQAKAVSGGDTPDTIIVVDDPQIPEDPE